MDKKKRRRANITEWVEPQGLTRADYGSNYDENTKKPAPPKQCNCKKRVDHVDIKEPEPTRTRSGRYDTIDEQQDTKHNQNSTSESHNSGFDMSSLLGMMDQNNPLIKMAIDMFMGGNKSPSAGGGNPGTANPFGLDGIMKLMPMLLNSGILNGGLFGKGGGSTHYDNQSSGKFIDLAEYDVR